MEHNRGGQEEETPHLPDDVRPGIAAVSKNLFNTVREELSEDHVVNREDSWDDSPTQSPNSGNTPAHGEDPPPGIDDVVEELSRINLEEDQAGDNVEEDAAPVVIPEAAAGAAEQEELEEPPQTVGGQGVERSRRRKTGNYSCKVVKMDRPRKTFTEYFKYLENVFPSKLEEIVAAPASLCQVEKISNTAFLEDKILNKLTKVQGIQARVEDKNEKDELLSVLADNVEKVQLLKQRLQEELMSMRAAFRQRWGSRNKSCCNACVAAGGAQI